MILYLFVPIRDLAAGGYGAGFACIVYHVELVTDGDDSGGYVEPDSFTGRRGAFGVGDPLEFWVFAFLLRKGSLVVIEFVHAISSSWGLFTRWVSFSMLVEVASTQLMQC